MKGTHGCHVMVFFSDSLKGWRGGGDMDCHLDNTVLEAEAQHAEFFVNINTPVEKQECSLIGNVSGWVILEQFLD